MFKKYWVEFELVKKYLNKVSKENTLLNPKNLESIKSIRKFIKNGADVNLKDEHHVTPLEVAVKYSNLEIISYLVHRGADINKGNMARMLKSVCLKESIDIQKLKYLLSLYPEIEGKFEENEEVYSIDAIQLVNLYVDDKITFLTKYSFNK